MRFGASPTIGPSNLLMGLPVGVPRNGESIGSMLDQAIEVLSICQAGERYVHHEHYQSIFWHFLQIATQKGQLFGVQTGNKMHGPIIKRIVIGSIDPGEGLIGVFVIGGIHVHVMVTNNVEPRDPHEGNGRIEGFKHAQIIKDNVSQGHPKLGLRSNQLLDHIMPDIGHLADVSRLRIPKKNHFKCFGLLGGIQGKVNGFGKRSGRLEARKGGLR